MATPQQNFEAGRSALRVFFSETVRLFPDSPISQKGFDGFIEYVRNLTPPDFKQNDIERLGDAILISQYPLSRVNEVMKQLALAYIGRLPDKKGMVLMLDALYKDSISISYKVEMATSAVKEGAKELGSYALGGLGLYAIILGGIAIFALKK